MARPTTNTGDTDAGTEPGGLIGKVVHDRAKARLGKVMDKVGPRYQLRPLDGGQEWEANGDDLEIVTPPRCATCDRLKAERGKAQQAGRSDAARLLTEALGRHLRVMHP